jgi:hypothetical protein
MIFQSLAKTNAMNMPPTGICLALLCGASGGAKDSGNTSWINNDWGYNLGFVTRFLLSTN